MRVVVLLVPIECSNVLQHIKLPIWLYCPQIPHPDFAASVPVPVPVPVAAIYAVAFSG